MGFVHLFSFLSLELTSGLPREGFIPQPSPRPKYDDCIVPVFMIVDKMMIVLIMMMMIVIIEVMTMMTMVMVTFWEDLSHSQERGGQPNDACLE